MVDGRLMLRGVLYENQMMLLKKSAAAVKSGYRRKIGSLIRVLQVISHS